ncbi:MAG: LacI family DNA-binding transcriptional regulator [Rubrivivax sp.]|nr:LacI family DNA-binding transcriptional regulator [Rubrivivax sp.]
MAKRINLQQQTAARPVPKLFDLDTLQIETYLDSDPSPPPSSSDRPNRLVALFESEPLSSDRLERLVTLFETEARSRSRVARPTPSEWPADDTPGAAEAQAAVVRQEEIIDASRRALAHIRQLRRAIEARDAERAAAVAMLLVCDMLHGGFVLRADANESFVRRTRKSKAEAASKPRKVDEAKRALIKRTFAAKDGAHGALKETARRANVSTTTASRVLVEEGLKGPARRNRK